MKNFLKPTAMLFAGVALAAAAFWYSQQNSARHSDNAAENSASHLSASSKAVLASLNSPVEIHFYSLLDPASVPDSVRAFAGRVSQLLADYEREGGGNIKLVRYEADLNASAGAASADGIRAFNIDKGDACYLGIAIVRGQKKESIPQLSQEWEPALEFDLSRAIARVNEASPSQPTLSASPSGADVAAVEQLMRSNPALASASLEQGTEMLRTAALAEFKATATEMQARMAQAEQRLVQAQNAKSEAEEKAAATELQQIRAEQTEKLKQMAARLQNQIVALQQAKAPGQ